MSVKVSIVSFGFFPICLFYYKTFQETSVKVKKIYSKLKKNKFFEMFFKFSEGKKKIPQHDVTVKGPLKIFQ